MRRYLFLALVLFVSAWVPVFGDSWFRPSDTVLQGVVVEKWELGKWQVDDDSPHIEGYSRFQVLIESPQKMRGNVVTIFYNKRAVPQQFIPKRKGVHCGFTVAKGVADSGTVLWPTIHQFWLGTLRAAPQALPQGTPGDSL